MKKLVITLTLSLAALTAQADTLYGALRDGSAEYKSAGLIAYDFPAGTTDGLRYKIRPRVGSLAKVSHREPAGTTDRVRQLASLKGYTSAVYDSTVLAMKR